MLFVPLTSSLAETVTDAPTFVEPAIHPAVFVTLGITDMEWLLMLPFAADGVPSLPAATLFVAVEA